MSSSFPPPRLFLLVALLVLSAAQVDCSSRIDCYDCYTEKELMSDEGGGTRGGTVMMDQSGDGGAKPRSWLERCEGDNSSRWQTDLCEDYCSTKQTNMTDSDGHNVTRITRGCSWFGFDCYDTTREDANSYRYHNYTVIKSQTCYCTGNLCNDIHPVKENYNHTSSGNYTPLPQRPCLSPPCSPYCPPYCGDGEDWEKKPRHSGGTGLEKGGNGNVGWIMLIGVGVIANFGRI